MLSLLRMFVGRGAPPSARRHRAIVPAWPMLHNRSRPAGFVHVCLPAQERSDILRPSRVTCPSVGRLARSRYRRENGMEGAPGWAGRILLADLDRGEARCIPTSDYAAQALGGRSLGAALAWDLVRPGMDAFDPGNPLMFLSGPLAGSMAPSAGRITVCALSPQCYPKPWFSRSSMGGDLGHQLKAAGYDGVVVIGRAPRPVYLCITTQGASIEDAEGLWGLGIMATQATLQGRHGARARWLPSARRGEPVPHRLNWRQRGLGGRPGRLWRRDGLQESQGRCRLRRAAHADGPPGRVPRIPQGDGPGVRCRSRAALAPPGAGGPPAGPRALRPRLPIPMRHALRGRPRHHPP